MVSVPPSGWAAWVLEPTTDRILPAEVLDDPQITPSFNSLPRIRLPVPQSDIWQELDGTEPAFTVYKDGAEQPIDELLTARDNRERAATVLEGRGGIELLDVVEKEYDDKRPHEAMREIIQNETTYDDDVATPNPPVLEDEVLQTADTDTTWGNISTALADTDPIAIQSGQFQLQQSCFFGRTDDLESGETVVEDATATENWDDNDAMDYDEANPIAADHTITPTYTIPEENVGVMARLQGDWPNNITVKMNGEEQWSLSGNQSFGASPSWIVLNEDDDGLSGSYLHFPASYTSGDLAANTQQTLTFNAAGDNTGGTDHPYLDCLVVYDDRFEYTVDNTTGGLGVLAGPELYPDAFEFEFDNVIQTFAVTSLTASLEMVDDETGGSQRVQVSSDGGNTWKPDDGTEDNTESVTVDPIDPPGSEARFRVRLSRTGSRGGPSPTEGFDGQAIDSATLTADIEKTALLIDYAEEQSILDHFNAIAGDQFIWSYRVVDGTKTVTVTEPGQRTATDTPRLIEATVTKDFEQYHSITVRGANKRIVDEEFSASTSFVNLNQSNIVPGTESVRSTLGVNYDRGTDYEMNWRDGEIRAIGTGDLAIGSDYLINYQHEVRGTYTATQLPTNFKSRTVDIPGITSTRLAEQIAFVLVEIEGFDAPRYVADIRVPPGETTFDAVGALSIDALPRIPADAGPLEVEEPPTVTPGGTAFRLGTRQELEARLAELRDRVRQVSRRSG